MINLLGESLQENLDYCGGRFSAITILMIGIQVVSRIQQLHNAGYSHEDISLNNLLMGRRDAETVYILDFGLSMKLRGPEAAPRGRRADLLSLGKKLVAMFNGWIPDSLDLDSGARGTRTLKEVRGLCQEIPEVIKYFEIVFERDFLKDSHYNRLRLALQTGLDTRTIDPYGLFDWMRL